MTSSAAPDEIDIPGRAPANLAGAFAGFAVAFNSAGFLSLVSHTANLFVPAFVIAWLMVVPGKLFTGISTGRLLMLSLLLVAVFCSAIFGVHSGLRAFGFAAFAMVPLLGLALVPADSLEQTVVDYAVVAALGMITWTLILYFFLGGNLGPWGSWTPAGTANLYGVHFNMIWPLLLFGATKARTGNQSAALRVLGAICLVLAILTFSRAAIFSAGLSFLLIMLRNGRRFTLAALTLLILILALFYQDAVLQMLTRLRLINFTPDLGRFKIWSLAWEISRNHLMFGVAPGGASVELAPIQVYHAHNNILNVLLESGLIAASLFALVTAALSVLAARAIYFGKGATYLGCSILAYLASGMVGTTITNPELTLTLVLVAGACASLLGRKPSQDPR